MIVALVVVVMLWCFRKVLGGRKVWKGDLLEKLAGSRGEGRVVQVDE